MLGLERLWSVCGVVIGMSFPCCALLKRDDRTSTEVRRDHKLIEHCYSKSRTKKRATGQKEISPKKHVVQDALNKRGSNERKLRVEKYQEDAEKKTQRTVQVLSVHSVEIKRKSQSPCKSKPIKFPPYIPVQLNLSL